MDSPNAELFARVNGLFAPGTGWQWAAVLGCVVAVWLAMRAMRNRYVSSSSILFGERIVDGVLFAALSLIAVAAWRWAVRASGALPVFDLAVAVLASLLLIRTVVRVLEVTFPNATTVKGFARSLSWAVWIGLILWITGLLPLMYASLDSIRWKLGGAPVSLASLIEAAVSAMAVLVLALWMSAAIEARLIKGASDDLSVRKIAANAVRALLLLVGLLLALTAAGIPLGALGVLGGAIGVGLGFGLQKLASNYVSGFVILAERSIRIGDMVKVDGFEGRITDIKTRYTVVRALNGRESIVPNEMLITQRVENSSLADPKVLLTSAVQVAHGTNVEALMPQLSDAVRGVRRVIEDPPPSVQLAGLSADGLDLHVLYWIGDPENGQGAVKSDVNLAILRTLTAHGVAMPTPLQPTSRTT